MALTRVRQLTLAESYGRRAGTNLVGSFRDSPNDLGPNFKWAKVPGMAGKYADTSLSSTDFSLPEAYTIFNRTAYETAKDLVVSLGLATAEEVESYRPVSF